MSYTVVTSNTVYPAQVSYQKIELTRDVVLSWPNSLSGGAIAAGFNNIIPDKNGWIIKLPDATGGSLGSDILFGNNSVYTFDIVNYNSNPVVTLAAGEVVDLKLTDISTQAGEWTLLPFLGKYSGVVSFTAESSDESIIITNGAIANPGGTIDFKLPASISNLNNVANTGLAVITATNPLTWKTATILAGDNIAVTNGDGINGNPVINLSPTVSNLNSLQVGTIKLTGQNLQTTRDHIDILINTSGSGVLNLNNVLIEEDGYTTIPTDLIVLGRFNNPFTPKAWCTFNDTVFGSSTTIIVEDGSNIRSTTPIVGGSGSYEIFFATPMANINYGVIISLGSQSLTSPPAVYNGFCTARSTSSVKIAVVDAGGQLVAALPQGATVMIMSSRNI